jgi:hypothetical protein
LGSGENKQNLFGFSLKLKRSWPSTLQKRKQKAILNLRLQGILEDGVKLGRRLKGEEPISSQSKCKRIALHPPTPHPPPPPKKKNPNKKDKKMCSHLFWLVF